MRTIAPVINRETGRREIRSRGLGTFVFVARRKL